MTEHNYSKAMTSVYVCMNMPVRQKRVGKTTMKQYEIMVDFLSQNIEMVTGKITASFSAEKKRMLWQKLSDTLNQAAGYGPKKDVWKWRKTWIDIKSDVKRKARALKKQQNMPDDCPDKQQPVERLSALEEKILKIIETASKEVDRIAHDGDCENMNEVLPNEKLVFSGQQIQLSAIETMNSSAEEVIKPDLVVVPSVEKPPEIKAEPSTEEDNDYFIQLPCTTSNEPGTRVDSYFAELPCSTGGANTQGESCSSQKPEPPPHITSTLSESMVCNSSSYPETLLQECASNTHEVNDGELASDGFHRTLSRTNKLLERLVTATEERNRIEQKRNDILFALLEKVFK